MGLVEEVRSLGRALKEDTGALVPSMSLLPGFHEVNRPPLPCTPALIYSAATGQSNEAK